MKDDRMVRRSEALADGSADHELRALYERGGWERFVHGVYVPSSRLATLTEQERHRLLIDALLPVLSEGYVVSHRSAALLHGLPLPTGGFDKVHITRHRRGGGRTNAAVTVHCAPSVSSVTVDGISVTSLAQTVVDLARTETLLSAVIAGDVALKRCDPRELDAELQRARGWKGVAQARRAVNLMDGRSENPGESQSRIILRESGFDVESQVEILDPSRRSVARIDWLVNGVVVCEFDGKAKYTKYLRPDENPGDVVFKEKIREDAVRDLGYPVVRWTWADLANPAELVARVARAVERAAALPPPLGSARSTPCGPHTRAHLPNAREIA
ncbi:hypothetical protein CH294_07145 [Rhodococcus sp. 14-2483-1-1]|uniref:type IV toxin-antitoxin system AbiEi family antitoxin domain-containing protein n=1 Tax=Rhodococcus sp. 14-2483-1-1 TaxID=2023148 RepID=UPI000B9BFF7C|nr:hypothetical protein [Rhodococcus sp. 14-2483-1-1]OZF39250.1 hypothetical protein CH294_07145 [Rhodococcus sp. 14-2483-1-1]